MGLSAHKAYNSAFHCTFSKNPLRPLMHRYQLDNVIVKHISLKFVLCTRTYHSADCVTDHSIVLSKIRLLPKKIHRNRQVGIPLIDTINMHYLGKVEEFVKSFVNALAAHHSHNSASEKWDHLRETI